MNCATHSDMLPWPSAVLAESHFVTMHPRRPRRDLLRNVPGCSPGRHSISARPGRSGIRSARRPPPPYTPVSVPAGPAARGRTFRPQSRSRRNPCRILSLRCGRGVLLAIRQGTGALAHLRAADLWPPIMPWFGHGLWYRHRVLLRLPDHRRGPHRQGAARGTTCSRSSWLGSDVRQWAKIRHRPRSRWAAVVLIGLGSAVSASHIGFWEFRFERFWPLILVCLGAFMFYRKAGMRGWSAPVPAPIAARAG